MAFDAGRSLDDTDAQRLAPARSQPQSTAPPVPWFSAPVLGYLAVLGAAALVTIAAIGPTQMAASADAAGPDLARLLRAMAAIKGVLVLGLVAGVAWRLSLPVRARSWLWYTLAGSAMVSGTAALAALVGMAYAAVTLHAGMAATAVLLWRDQAIRDQLRTALKSRPRTDFTRM